LLLLLFRGSHQLEHRLTEKAAGGLQRLFDSVPDRAVVVEVEEGSNAPRVATTQEVWTGKACAWDRQGIWLGQAWCGHTSHDNKQQGNGVVWATTFNSQCHVTCVHDDCFPLPVNLDI
jgi:cation transport ATPase